MTKLWFQFVFFNPLFRLSSSLPPLLCTECVSRVQRRDMKFESIDTYSQYQVLVTVRRPLQPYCLRSRDTQHTAPNNPPPSKIVAKLKIWNSTKLFVITTFPGIYTFSFQTRIHWIHVTPTWFRLLNPTVGYVQKSTNCTVCCVQLIAAVGAVCSV